MPRRIGANRKRKGVLAVGVGTAGCRITSTLQKSVPSIGHFAYVSTEAHDIPSGSEGDKTLIEPPTPIQMSHHHVRTAARPYLPKLRRLFGNSSAVLLAAGLGGNVGTGLAPLLAEEAEAAGVPCVCIAAMPFSFEKEKHFRAGCALRVLRKSAQGIIVIDNDALLDAVPQMIVPEAYAAVNDKLSEALGWLLSTGFEGLEVGFEKVVNTVANGGFSVLGVAKSSAINRAEEAVLKAVNSIYKAADPDETRRAILFLAGEDGVKMTELSASTHRLRSSLGADSLEVHHGVASGRGGGQLTAIVLASGLKTTRFDDYDPLGKMLKDVDGGLEYHLDVPMEQFPTLD